MSQKDKDFLEQALTRFNKVQSDQMPVRELSKSDRAFSVVRGEQWRGNFDEQFSNKPKIEVNKIARAIKRINSEYRNNKTNVAFIAREDDVSEDDAIADIATGAMRADEKDSAANEAYDNAWFEGVSGGMGGWRLRTVHEDELDPDDDKQRVYFEPIYEADQSVYFDPNSKRYDKSDAQYCFVVHSMTREAYEMQYKDDCSSWPKSSLSDSTAWTWARPDLVYIAEYYTVHSQPEQCNYYRLVDGREEEYTQDELEEDDNLRDTLEATGAQLLRVELKRKRVIKKSLLTGGKVLEKPRVIAGRYIPVIPFYGMRFFLDGVEHYAGETRHARDAQILQNIMVSQMVDVVSYSGAEVPIMIPEEVEGLAQQWADRAVSRPPFLLKKAVDLNGQRQVLPQQYLKNPDVPPALAALHQVANIDLKDILGRGEQAEQLQSNLSGKAIELVQQRLDEQSFVYLDNMAKSREHSARVWLSMTKDIAKNRKTIKTIDDADKATYKKIAMPVINQETGEKEIHNDLTDVDLDVSVTIGPSTESKRSAVVRQLTGVLQMVADPEQQRIITSAIMMNLQGEGLAPINDYYRQTLVKAGVIKPTKEEAEMLAQQQQQQQQPDPQAMYLLASAEKQKADAVQSQAKTANIEADTVKKYAEVEEMSLNSVLTQNQNM